MTRHHIRPITSPGAWTFEGGYRKRAEQTLVLLEQKVAARRAKELKQGQRLDLDAVDEIHALSDSAIIFSAMAVESFLSLYGVIRLGEEFYSGNSERMSPSQKLSALMAMCCGELLTPRDEIVKVVVELFERRNALVHPKTHEVRSKQGLDPKTKPMLPAARAKPCRLCADSMSCS